MRVIAGKLDGVTVRTLCKLVADVEVEEDVDEVRVLSGELRLRALRTRSLSAIVIVACTID